jgi:hypothetical protein
MGGVCFVDDIKKKEILKNEIDKTISKKDLAIRISKRNKINYIIFNCFGWSILILLMFFSPDSAIIFFLAGSFVFNWGINFLFKKFI